MDGMDRSRSLPIILVVLVACLAPQTASAAYGDLDADFGVGGKLGDVGVSRPTAVKIQQDRKILVFGSSPSEPAKSRVVRLNRNGERDKTFGSDGFASLPASDWDYNMRLLEDGRIAVVAGGNRIVVLRPDGSPDTGFDADGVLAFGDTPTSLTVTSIAPQRGGKILVSGSFVTGPNTTIARVIRLTESGSLDTTFGISGVVDLPGTVGSFPGGSPLATTPDGEVLVGAFRPTSPSPALERGVMKLSASGTLINNFGTGGFATDSGLANRALYQGFERTTEIVVARDGSFAQVGRNFRDSGRGGGFEGYSWAFYRADGVAKTGFPKWFYAVGVTPVDGPGLAVSRASTVTVYKPDMTPDPTFGLAGTNSVNIGKCSEWKALATDVDGSIVALGACPLGGDVSQMVRFLGPNGGRPAVQVNIRGLAYSKKFRGRRTRVSWPRVLTGTAGPRGWLRNVRVAVRRLDWASSGEGHCGWLTKSATRYSRGKNCDKPVFMPVKGLGRWRFDFGRPLPVGNYELHVRAKLKNGSVNAFGVDADSYRKFSVKRPPKKK